MKVETLGTTLQKMRDYKRKAHENSELTEGGIQMSQVCRICTHPDKLKIERAIMRGIAKSRIGALYGVSESSVRNHAEFHLSRQLLKSHDMREKMQTQSLIEEVNQLIARTKAILDETERKQLHHVSLKAIAELRQTYAFMISTAFMLKEDQRSEAEARRREQVEDLKERFNREELELIHRIMTKSPNERLVYIRIEPASPI